MINKNVKVTEKSGIYCFYNKLNSKRYIGQAVNINIRFHRHLAACFNRNEDSPLYRSFKKYGLDNFDFIILKECEIEQLWYWEIYYISYYKTNICKYGDKYGYNLTDGGDGGTLGYKWTEEQKNNQKEVQTKVMLDYFQTEKGKEQAKKHSEFMTGRKQSEETIKKKSDSLKGTVHNDEWNKKVSVANTGRKHTELARKHMSDAHIGQIPVNKGIPCSNEQKDLISKVTTGTWFMTKEGERIYHVIPRRIQEYIDKGYYRCSGSKNREPWKEKDIKNYILSEGNKGSILMTDGICKPKYVIPVKQQEYYDKGWYWCDRKGNRKIA